MHEDTGGCIGYDLYQSGTLLEKIDASGLDIVRFESTLRKKPARNKITADFPDKYLREFGIYIPACVFLTGEGVMIRPASKDLVDRVDLVAVTG